jgi:cell division protein FtsL
VWPRLARAASGAAVDRFRVRSYARAYLAAAALMVLAIVYLAVSAQATQTSYDLNRLKEQSAQMQAEQDQLRYQDARMHTPAGVQRAATAAGMQRAAAARYAGPPPVTIDLDAPIGPGRPADTPLWQQAVAFLTGGVRDAQAAGR